MATDDTPRRAGAHSQLRSRGGRGCASPIARVEPAGRANIVDRRHQTRSARGPEYRPRLLEGGAKFRRRATRQAPRPYARAESDEIRAWPARSLSAPWKRAS